MPILLIILLLASAITHGKETPVEKVRHWTQTFPLHSKDRLVRVDNRFGTLRVVTWDRNDVRVEVTITAKAGNEKEAESLAEEVEIRARETDNHVSVSTRFREGSAGFQTGENGFQSILSRRGQSVRIDMTVTLPSTQPVEATNKFGTLILPDYRGPVELNSQFGKLVTGSLNAVTRLEVKFGSLEIEALTGGEGKIDIAYSNGTIQNLDGNADIGLSFGNLTLGLSPSLKSLDIQSSYANLSLDIPGRFDADMDISTRFGNFKNLSRTEVSKKSDDRDREKARYRVGAGGVPIKATSDFGNITIRDRKTSVSL